MGSFHQDIPLKCFTFFTLTFIVLITQYALFMKNAVHSGGQQIALQAKC